MSAQLALPVDPGRRVPYPTGLQVPCVGCAAAGIDKQGLTRDGPVPLCIPCWYGRRQRAGARGRIELRTALWDGIGAAEEAADCPACESDMPAESWRRKDRTQELGCWLCGSRWVGELRAQFDVDQEEARNAEALAFTERFERLAEITAAEVHAERWARLAERCRAVLERGAVARPVLLVAAAFARFGLPGRGRPPTWPRVAAAVALAAERRAGRYSRPGRADTAVLAGCTERGVTDGFRFLEDRPATPEAPGTGEPGPNRWMLRTVEGRLATLDDRQRLGVSRIRAEFDIVPAHLLPAPDDAHVRAALAVFVELLAAAVAEHERAAELVDALRVDQGDKPDAAGRVRRAQLRAAVERGRADIDQIIYSPHPVGLKLVSVYSCSLVGAPSRKRANSTSVIRHGAARGRRRGALRAQHRNPGSRCGPAQRVDRPRTARGACSRPNCHAPYIEAGTGSGYVLPGQSLGGYNITVIMHRNLTMCNGCPVSTAPTVRRRPEWSDWAPGLAHDLRKLWPWLRRTDHRGTPTKIAAVAAALGAKLGPQWTAAMLVEWVDRRRARPVLAEPRRPLGYLCSVLDEVLTGLDEPPAPARLHDERRRQLLDDERAELRAEAAEWTRRAELRAAEDRDREVAAPDAPGRLAARAIAARQ